MSQKVKTILGACQTKDVKDVVREHVTQSNTRHYPTTKMTFLNALKVVQKISGSEM